MTSRTGVTSSLRNSEPSSQRTQIAGRSRYDAPSRAANDHLDSADIVGLRVNALLEQLIAMRVELVHGVVPRAERNVLTARDLDYVRVQLDAAIAASRGIAATCGSVSMSIVRQRDFWRSEEMPATKFQEPS